MTSVVLWADNFDETAEFYRLLLNATFENKSDDFVAIVRGANEVLLHRVSAEWASVISVPPVVRDENPIKPCFEVASIDEARTAVAHTNGQVFASDREQTHGSKTYCDGFDTEGNVIQLFVLG